MRRYYFTTEAKAELDDAVDFYNGREFGLGFRFAREVERAMELVLPDPESWECIGRSTHRCPVKDFPYGILFQKRNEDVVVVAVMHMHRKPGYWQGRA